MKIGEILIRRDREHPFRANLPDISEYSYWDCTEHNPGEEKKSREDVCIFDIEKYVKRFKKEKMQTTSNNLNQSSENEKFNVDELVARIDKKIEELEKEEKAEKEKGENAKKINRNNKKGKNGSKKTPPTH